MGPALLQLLSWACIVFSLGMFGTGLSDLRQMFTSQSVENIQFLPFLTTDVKYAPQIGPGGSTTFGASSRCRIAHFSPGPARG
ncbi:hypothetical protein lerEdw1_003057 [Lerista edwardsae]|nr:hypothetical protein lerEdw1_003057 [Lerista edwardsae]